MVRCPSCGSESFSLGEIPAANIFAGRELSQPLPGGELFCCRGCSLWFRWPQLSKAAMDDLYAFGCDDTWAAETAIRRDWRLGSEILAGMKPGSVLDVGCFDGGFLSMVSPSWRRFGIEMNAAAAGKATARGVTILGPDYQAIEGTFDAIMAFDVIEHVADPAAFLRHMVAATTPDGIVVISTGNTKSLPWRWMKGNYWYCRFPEHISFINPGWCKRQARKLGLTAETYRFSRGGETFPKRLRELGVNVLYRMLPALKALGLRPGSGKLGRLAKEGPPVMWPNDHMLAVFRHSRPAPVTMARPVVEE